MLFFNPFVISSSTPLLSFIILEPIINFSKQLMNNNLFKYWGGGDKGGGVARKEEKRQDLVNSFSTLFLQNSNLRETVVVDSFKGC